MKTWWRRAALVGVAVVAMAGGTGALVAAESRPPAKAESPEAAAARELVRLVTPKETYEQMLVQMATALTQSLRAQAKDLPPDFETKVPLVVRDILPYEEMLEWSIELYSKRFTVAELKQMTAFYRTPVGQKCIRLMPEISAEVGARIGTFVPSKLPEAMRKHGLL